MINPNDFDGGLRFGPKTFVEQTGRNKVWAEPRRLICDRDRLECPTCGGVDRRPIFPANPQTSYVACKTCGMIYASTLPTDEVLLDYYQHGSAPASWAEHVQQNQLEITLDRLKFRWALELAGWGAPNDVLLDVGCSTGTLLSVAGEMVASSTRLIGLEVNARAASVAEAVVPGALICRDMSAASARIATRNPLDGRPNFLVLWEVLEHVVDPAKLLLDAAKLMRSSPATILICVPNAHSLAAKVLHEKAPMFGTGHFNIWGPSTLQLFLQRYLPGFTVEYRSIISWVKEVTNHYRFMGPFDDDPEVVIHDPAAILKNLEGYKLVAVARRA